MIYKILQEQVFIKKFYFQVQILIHGRHLKQHSQKIKQKKNLIKNQFWRDLTINYRLQK